MNSSSHIKKKAVREFDFRNNSLSLIKLLAAFEVMYVHLNAHLQLPKWSGSAFVSYFSGVPIFFIISGYLIWASIIRSNTYKDYLVKRFWRIYPELWLAVIVEICTILLMYRSYRIKELGIFAITQGTILQFWTPNSLRQYGCGTPNGTLWTICVMIQFYIIAWFIHKWLNKKKYCIWIIGFICLLVISGIGKKIAIISNSDLLVKLYDQSIVEYCWLFYYGCLLSEFKERIIPLLIKYYYVFILVGIIPFATKIDIEAGYHVLRSILLVSGLIGFAYRFPQMKIKKDISYGLFLYHMIITNIFITKGWIGNWHYALFIVLISVCCAYCSTVVIGQWANRMKTKIAMNSQPQREG